MYMYNVYMKGLHLIYTVGSIKHESQFLKFFSSNFRGCFFILFIINFECNFNNMLGAFIFLTSYSYLITTCG